MRSNALPFAGERARRPYETAASESEPRRVSSSKGSIHQPETVGLSSPGLTSSRQEVPESIGLGQSSPGKRLPGEEP